jgi:hypothetical protein
MGRPVAAASATRQHPASRAFAAAVVIAGAVTGLIAGILARDDDDGATSA